MLYHFSYYLDLYLYYYEAFDNYDFFNIIAYSDLYCYYYKYEID
jgi:hypothetical protein